MNPYEDGTLVFILRAWVEKREIEQQAPERRGVILNAVTGERVYWKNLDEVMAFLQRNIPLADTPAPAEPTPKPTV